MHKSLTDPGEREKARAVREREQIKEDKLKDLAL